MSFVTLDFETYYDQQFSLKRLTTEEYIRDPRFEVIGVAMKIDEDETQWFSGTHEEIKAWLNQVDWNTSALLCHNAQFDGAILSFIFMGERLIYFLLRLFSLFLATLCTILSSCLIASEKIFESVREVSLSSKQLVSPSLKLWVAQSILR